MDFLIVRVNRRRAGCSESVSGSSIIEIPDVVVNWERKFDVLVVSANKNSVRQTGST
ncbi:hypothetical protein D3C86_2246190 [compost metagenome]